MWCALPAQTEDYFLSASYFDEGRFTTSQSGLTYKTGSGGIASYKVHTRDLVLWSDGFNLTWRNMEDASCPTRWGGGDAAAAVPPPPRVRRSGVGVAPATYNTLVWYYTWASSDSGRGSNGGAATAVTAAHLAVLARAAAMGAVSASDAAAATALLMRGDAAAHRLAALLDVPSWSGGGGPVGEADAAAAAATTAWSMVAAGVRSAVSA